MLIPVRTQIKYYKLSDSWDNSNSPVTTAVGTESNSFTGTFDGNGKTLNVNISDTSNQGTAPFRHIKDGAVIKNLTTAGSVTGTTHASGLVGFSVDGSAEAPNTIDNCIVNVAVSVTSASGDLHMGGVVGHGVMSYLKIKDTVFSGTMTNKGSYAGGLQGWSDGNHLTIENCLFKGSYSGSGLFHPIAIHNNGSNTTFSGSNNYYTAEPNFSSSGYIITSAAKVYESAPLGSITETVTAADGNTYYKVTGYEVVTTISTAYIHLNSIP